MHAASDERAASDDMGLVSRQNNGRGASWRGLALWASFALWVTFACVLVYTCVTDGTPFR